MSLRELTLEVRKAAHRVRSTGEVSLSLASFSTRKSNHAPCLDSTAELTLVVRAQVLVPSPFLNEVAWCFYHLWHSEELSLSLTGCSTQENGPCLSPEHHKRAGTGVRGLGELDPRENEGELGLPFLCCEMAWAKGNFLLPLTFHSCP